MARQHNQLRIIGGEWRGRKLAFPDGEGLRPTPDRVRETVFNWLMPVIQGARCLDLFAGSGAMGLEALSRGASRVVMLDTNRQCIQQLNANLAILNGTLAQVRHQDALSYLQGESEAFDIVFLDPPYAAGLLPECIQLLESGNWLKPSACIYMECASSEDLPELPADWKLHRSKKAGQVAYHLAIRECS